MRYNIIYAGLNMFCEPDTFSLSFSKGKMTRSFCGTPWLELNNNIKVPFSDAKCSSEEFRTGVSAGIRARYYDFSLPAEADSSFAGISAVTETEITYDGQVKISVYLENEPEKGVRSIALQAISFNAPKGTGYTVLPRMQGLLLPAESEETIYDGHFNGIVYERDAYMPVFGQVTDADGFGKGYGYAAIYDTAFDAQYIFDHEPGKDTLITPLFIASLGRIGYKRTMLYIFEENCDYTRIAKIYRQYLKEHGKLVTLNEKITRNPNIAKLLGTTVIHAVIGVHISPDSNYYDKDHPEKNDFWTSFEESAEKLRKLKENGIDHAYLHFDGWGNHGYDNLHPSPFPPHEAAGGAEGMKKLSDTCREIGYMFGIHDNYRDFYYDAPDFDMDEAIENEDGSHPYCDVWYGGKHSWLCSKVAPQYVKRNYDEFNKLGIHIDGTYLDVFSVVFMDECFNPHHKATREQCCANRRECFELLNSRGIITSSEETVDCVVPSIALCHHSPYFQTQLGQKTNVPGIPIPFFNLVWHDCIVVPWDFNTSWGIPVDYDGYGLAFINGGTAYSYMTTTPEFNEKASKVLDLHKKIGNRELLRHELIDNDPLHQRSVFDSEDGEIVVEVDFHEKNAKINIK